MAFKSFKDKLTNIAGNEVLGETSSFNDEKIEKNKTIKNPKKKVKEKPAVIKRETQNNTDNEKKDRRAERAEKYKKERVNKRRVITEEIVEEAPIIINKAKKSNQINETPDSIEGYEDVLSILGIKEKMNLEVGFKSEDLDYVEFTQTTPLGFDFDEVTHFISSAKYALYTYEKAIIQRDKEIIKVASEVKRVEQKMVEQNQEKELARILGGQTEEERLIEENMELKIELNNLQRKLRELSLNADNLEDLNKEIETLRSENEFLRTTAAAPPIQQVQTSLPKVDQVNKNKGLPEMDLIEDEEIVNYKKQTHNDPFGDMLNDIGGLYDE